MSATDNAVLIEAAVAADRTGDPRRFLSGLKRVDKPPVLAARLSGTLDSAYPDGPPADKDKRRGRRAHRTRRPRATRSSARRSRSTSSWWAMPTC